MNDLEQKSSKKILWILTDKLKLAGIEIASVQRAYTTNSIYVKFTDERLRSLTVRDHPGIPKYRYKWNLFRGWKGGNEEIDRGVRRFYYSFADVQKLADRIIQYKQTCDKQGEQNGN